MSLVALAAALTLPAPVGAAWRQPVGGPSPINQSPTGNVTDSLGIAEVGGVPYVAWDESDGSSQEIRVARFDGTDWVQPWFGVSNTYGGINQSGGAVGSAPHIASIGGVPYVAWVEDNPGIPSDNREVRVARLVNGAWEQPWSPGSSYGGVNRSTSQNADTPSITSFNGVAAVAWTERDATNSNSEIRVAVLNTATDTWTEPWTGVSDTDGRINHSTLANAVTPSLATIGGRLHVAWVEHDGSNNELRVARLPTPTALAWEQPWAGVTNSYGGINQSTVRDSSAPSLSAVGGVPYVAWGEVDSVNREIRVARLTSNAWAQPATAATTDYGGINQSAATSGANPVLADAAGVPHVVWSELSSSTAATIRVARLKDGAWSQPWTGASGATGGINESATQSGERPSLTAINGVPWVAWRETDEDTYEMRASRLEPEFTSASASPSPTGATLSAGVRTYGVPFPVGFLYGPALEHEATAEPAPVGADDVTVTREIGGLAPSTSQQFRPFATAGVPLPRVLGPVGTFTTLAAPLASLGSPPRGLGPPGPGDVVAAVLSGYRLAPTVFRAAARGASLARRRPPVGTRVSYTLSEPATVTFTVQRRTTGRRVRGRCRAATRANRRRPRCVRHVPARGSFRHAGRAGVNRLRFTGRLRGRKLAPGAYRLRARAVDAAGNASPIAARGFRVVRG